MRTKVMVLILSIIGFATTLPGFGQPAVPLTPDFSQPLTDDEANYLIFMLEEEKMARDVYEYLYEVWGVPAFANIADAEQRHLESVQWVLENYGYDTALLILEEGQFFDTKLAELYNTLVAEGSSSELAALWVGGLIEEVDIADLVYELQATDNPAIQNLFSNLLRGSRNHLRTFAGLIEAQGEQYVSQILDEEEVDGILSSPRERGGRGGAGANSGPGMGSNGGQHMGPNGSGQAGPGGNAGAGPKGPGTGNGSGPGDGSCQN